MTWKLQGQSRIMWHDETLYRLEFNSEVYVDGKLTKVLTNREPFRANVQPMNGRDLLLVPEHQRFIEQYWCFVPGKFFNKTGEVIHRIGQEPGKQDVHFQVQDIEYWGSYQRARIMRVDVGEYANP